MGIFTNELGDFIEFLNLLVSEDVFMMRMFHEDEVWRFLGSPFKESVAFKLYKMEKHSKTCFKFKKFVMMITF